jgi:hypothetical protein
VDEEASPLAALARNSGRGREPVSEANARTGKDSGAAWPPARYASEASSMKKLFVPEVVST